MISNNYANHIDTGVRFTDNIRLYYNLLDGKQMQSFPLYKIFYYSNAVDNLPNSIGGAGLLKVSDIADFNTNGASISGANYDVHYIDANTTGDYNSIVDITQNSCIAKTVSDIMEKFYFNDKIFTIKLNIKKGIVNFSDFGRQFQLDFNEIFGGLTQFTHVKSNFVLVGYEPNEESDTCTFFIRGDIYADN
jgi:hypothetical protein